MFKRFPPFLLVACISGIVAGGISYFQYHFEMDRYESAVHPEHIKKESTKLLLDLKGYWLFSEGDDKAWAAPDYYDSDWGEIRPGQPWEDQGYRHYDGFAWYRKHITIPQPSIKGDLLLKLGFIDDADEVYLNGILIGSSGGMPPTFQTAYNHAREYLIPVSQVKWGEENLIAVRVYDDGSDGGILEGPLGLFTTDPKPVPDIDLAGIWEFVLEPELKKSGEDAVWTSIIVPGI